MAKQILHNIKINEISSVDRPAQKGAVKVLMKRDESENTELKAAIKKIIAGDDVAQDIRALALTKLAEVNTAQGGLITEIEMTQTSKAADGEAGKDKMTDDEKEKLKDKLTQKSDELQSNLDEVTKQLDETKQLLTDAKETIAKSESMSSMNDIQKAHYDALEGDDAKSFLEKSFDDRHQELLTLAKKDTLLYKAFDGTEYRESDGERLAKLAKQSDETNAALKKSIEEKQTMELTKRAEDEFSNLPGAVETHVEMLKAIDGIEDEEARGEAVKVLKAQNASMAGAFKKVGSSAISKGQEGDPGAELEEMAKAYASKHDMNYLDAYDEVSKQNPDILEKAITG